MLYTLFYSFFSPRDTNLHKIFFFLHLYITPKWNIYGKCIDKIHIRMGKL